MKTDNKTTTKNLENKQKKSRKNKHQTNWILIQIFLSYKESTVL